MKIFLGQNMSSHTKSASLVPPKWVKGNDRKEERDKTKVSVNNGQLHLQLPLHVEARGGKSLQTCKPSWQKILRILRSHRKYFQKLTLIVANFDQEQK